jgi:hypothetical protein
MLRPNSLAFGISKPRLMKFVLWSKTAEFYKSDIHRCTSIARLIGVEVGYKLIEGDYWVIAMMGNDGSSSVCYNVIYSIGWNSSLREKVGCSPKLSPFGRLI